MNPEERQDLKRKIEEEIAAQKTLIASLLETSKPVAPDNAIRQTIPHGGAERPRGQRGVTERRPDQTVAVGNGIGQSGPTRFRPLRQWQQSIPAQPHPADARGHPLHPLRGEELTGIPPHSFA